ncbi:MAG: TetR/AcrR family transcriptional regulator [Mycobacterium sp.]|nr:TetR/AcrR family transcriptional regulator [Mycobacterium sp.]
MRPDEATGRPSAEPERIPRSAEAILDAAEGLFGQRGYAATSVAAICAASALPVGSIYHHFASKSAILSSVLDRAEGRFFAELDDAVGTRLDPEHRMRKYFEQAPRLMARNANYFRILVGALQQNDDAQLLTVARRSVEAAAMALASVIEPVAAGVGASDPAALSLDLAEMTNGYALGAAILASYDAQRLRARMVPLYGLIRGAIDTAAAQNGDGAADRKRRSPTRPREQRS